MAWINLRGDASVFSGRFPFAHVQRILHKWPVNFHQLGLSVEGTIEFVPCLVYHFLLTCSFLVPETLFEGDESNPVC